MEVVQSKLLTILGESTSFSEEQLFRYMYKSLNIFTKMKKGVDQTYLKGHVKNMELRYHPMWLAKLLIVADRKPFPPKKTPKMCFVDAVSGYRGLLTTVPPRSAKDVTFDESAITIPEIGEDDVKKYIRDVQEKQINRSYVLKKPEHELLAYDLVYLPLWKARVEGSLLKKDFIINANTGEAEDYLSSQWSSKKWWL